MESLQQKGLNICLVVRNGGKIVESDHVVRPQSDALLVAEPRHLLLLLVPEEVAVVVPDLGVVRSAGQAGLEQFGSGGPGSVPGEGPGRAEEEEGDDEDGGEGGGPGGEPLHAPGHQDTPAQAGRVESPLSCYKSHSLEYITGGQER